MWDTLFVPNLDKDWRFHIHVERFEIKDLARKSDRELAAWLEERWVQKSKRLEELQGRLESGINWSQDITPQERKTA